MDLNPLNAWDIYTDCLLLFETDQKLKAHFFFPSFIMIEVFFFPLSKISNSCLPACLLASINSPKFIFSDGGEGAPLGTGWTQVGRAAWDSGEGRGGVERRREERSSTLKGAERRSV